MTVQPLGIPDAPDGQLFIDDAFSNVPDEETPSSQSEVHSDVDMFVARHLT